MPHLGPRVRCSWRVCIFQQKMHIYLILFKITTKLLPHLSKIIVMRLSGKGFLQPHQLTAKRCWSTTRFESLSVVAEVDEDVSEVTTHRLWKFVTKTLTSFALVLKQRQFSIHNISNPGNNFTLLLSSSCWVLVTDVQHLVVTTTRRLDFQVV